MANKNIQRIDIGMEKREKKVGVQLSKCTGHYRIGTGEFKF